MKEAFFSRFCPHRSRYYGCRNTWCGARRGRDYGGYYGRRESDRHTKQPFQRARTLTANIVLEMGYAADLHREALIATAVVLFVFILIINLSFSAMKRRTK
jgi:hypothetical protein